MKALVTGASGFIGSTLIEELAILGFEVHALMRRTSSDANLRGLRYKRVEGDLSDPESLKRAVRDVDYVFHLAGVVSAKDSSEFFRHNADGTRFLAEAVAEARPGLSRFVYVSSLAAGGPASSLSPRSESEPDAPVSAYGESKLQGERELLKFKSVYPISIVRPPVVYGPKDKATFLFVQTVHRNLMPILKGSSGDGKKYYSLVHVKDLCRGIAQAGLAPREKVPSGEVFFIAGDDMVTYEEMLTLIAEHLHRTPLKIRVPTVALRAATWVLTGLSKVTGKSFPLTRDKLNELLPDYWICSNQKAKALLGFQPEFDASRGWGDAVDWYRREGWISL